MRTLVVSVLLVSSALAAAPAPRGLDSLSRAVIDQGMAALKGLLG